MKLRLNILLTLVCAVFIISCGGSSSGNNTTVKTSGTPSNAATNVGEPVVSSDHTPAGISVPTQSNSAPDINIPPAGNITVEGKRSVVEGPPPPPGSKPVTVVGAEGSEILTTMGPGGSFVETRTFLNKTSLVAKLQRITNGKDVTATLFLRSGKTVKMSPDSIRDFRMMESADLMRAAGLKVPVTEVPRSTGPVDPNSTTKQKN